MKKASGRLLGWLYARRYVCLLFAICFALLFIVYALYGYPWGVALYTGLLCLVAGLFFAVFDFVRYTARCRELEKIAGQFPTAGLPDPGNTQEEAYTRVIEALEEERRRLSLWNEKRQRDADQYYTLWAHQIKTPIAGMRLMLQREDAGARGDMELSLFRIEQYVEMVLQYQRLTTMEGDLVFAEQDLQKIVNRAVKGCAPLFIYKNLPLRLGEIEGRVVTDEKWMVFVLEQVLTNALKYTNTGEVCIYTEGDTLVVADTGIGIAPEDLPRVFERGYTGAVGRTERSSTGLGLYLCREILKRLGFGIDIESAVGQGTRVKLLLAQKALPTD